MVATTLSQRRSFQRKPEDAGGLPPPLLMIRDVVAYTRVSEKTIRRAVGDGKLRAFKLPGGLRFRLEDVDEWVESFAVRPDPVPQKGRRRMLSEVLA
jgi:excisionase family DNA binding protein